MLLESLRDWTGDVRRSADFIRKGWDLLSPLPGGRRLYSRWLGSLVPYTGSISPRVVALRDGFARVVMQDRPRLRNHLGSLHAVALCNLAELTANLAFGYSLPRDSRFIITEIDIRYLKKARGPIEAECRCEVPSTNARREVALEVALFDSDQNTVARATITSLLSPVLGHS